MYTLQGKPELKLSLLYTMDGNDSLKHAMWQAEDANEADEAVSRTKHVWYSEHGMYCRFKIILEQVMSATHVAVIPCTRTSPAYEEEFTKMDYPDARNGYGTS